MNLGARHGIAVGIAVAALGACTSPSADSTGPAPASPAPTATSATASERVATSGSETTELDEATVLGGRYTVEVVAIHPHDPDAYTQGLELHDGLLLESTGRFGESSRRWVVPETGEIVGIEPLDDELFGEGITMVDDQIFQLTWTNGRVLLADGATLEQRSEIGHEGEGWGICHDGTALIMSNGSADLTIRDPETFVVRSTIPVTNQGASVPRLNELECRAGQVLANVYGSDEIVVIDPKTGLVVATIDAGDLRPSDLPIDDLDFALNGIAHDRNTGTLYLTGKLWPVLYEVRLVAG
ncbi:MAG: glutaminyl-peptide cyclotransferase [Actinomycetota bacterium]|nr:glutaminyl-peptide cyclotransferase [Actinomycetota bacterium]